VDRFPDRADAEVVRRIHPDDRRRFGEPVALEDHEPGGVEEFVDLRGERGARHDTRCRGRPPVGALSFENTSRCAIAYCSARNPRGSRPASFSSAHRSATPRAQKKMRFFTAPPASAFSSTRAYIFSYSRGTETAMVGRTWAIASGTRCD